MIPPVVLGLNFITRTAVLCVRGPGNRRTTTPFGPTWVLGVLVAVLSVLGVESDCACAWVDSDFVLLTYLLSVA